MNPARTQEQGGTPLVPWTVAGLLGWGTVELWQRGQAGNDLAALGSVLLAFLTVTTFFKGLTTWDRWRDWRRMERAARTPSEHQGKSRFATLKDLKRAGLLTGKGIFLGRFQGRDIRYDGENSILTVARPGAGKSSAFFRVTSRTVDGWMQAGIVPYFKIGRSVRFRLPDVINNLKERHQIG